MKSKNTTASSLAQYQMLTQRTDFLIVDGENRSPFAVNEGIDVGEALNIASCLLGALEHIATMSIDRNPTVNDSYAMRFLCQASHALINASVPAVESFDAPGGAK